MGKQDTQDEAPAEASPPQTIDQVRELLFGAEQRTLETQLEDLRQNMHALQADLEQQLNAARSELQQAIAKTDSDHKARLTDVGNAIEEVGRAIGTIASR